MKETKFGTGLFSNEELGGDFDRNKKLEFLNRLMELIQMVTNEPPTAKANMVIAGKECENTNLMLQQLYRAATSGVDTQKFVNKMLGKAEPEPPKKREASPPPAPKEEPKKRKASPPAEKKKSPSPMRQANKKKRGEDDNEEGGYYAQQVKAQVERENVTKDETGKDEFPMGKKGGITGMK